MKNRHLDRDIEEIVKQIGQLVMKCKYQDPYRGSPKKLFINYEWYDLLKRHPLFVQYPCEQRQEHPTGLEFMGLTVYPLDPVIKTPVIEVI